MGTFLGNEEIYDRLEQDRIVPVVVVDNIEAAIPLANAIYNGGLKCAEITFRTDCAADAIRAMKDACPDMVLGAGTVITTLQVDEAMAAGAQFIVSPGFDPEVVDYCINNNIPIIPGCMTPSEFAQAVKRGIKVIKFFPANEAGGVPMLKAIAAPYKDVRFMPTGGISAENIQEYLGFSKVLACGGTWMVKPALIADRKYDVIEKLVAEAVTMVAPFKKY